MPKKVTNQNSIKISLPINKKPPKNPSDLFAITICKTAQTESLEGKSNLTYEIGKDTSDILYWRITKNDGGGYFSDEWIKDTDIQAALSEWPMEKPITSLALQGLFLGKSANNRSFLLAALANEGLLVRKTENQRHYELGDHAAFMKQFSKASSKKPEQT